MLLCLWALPLAIGHHEGRTFAVETKNKIIDLPPPSKDSEFSVERAIFERRSVREFRTGAITLPQLSQLLWSAQGITDHRGFRTAPSAGALYPLEMYVMVGHVDELGTGIYKYQADNHELIKMTSDDRRKQVQRVAWNQDWIAQGAVLIVFCAVDSRTTGKYGHRGVRYVHIEVGHAAQNMLLQAQALGLGAAVVGAFNDDSVQEILHLPENERALYLIPIGTPR